MAFQKYNSANKAIAFLDLPITESSNTLELKGAFARFPTSNFIVTVTEFDSITGDVIFRENMLISSRSGNICNIITREFEPIPQTDDATTSIQESFPFSADSVVEVVNSSAFNKDIQDEVTRLESDKLNKGALRTALANTWRMFFSNGSNNETELAFGASGRVLQSNGTTSAPTWVVPTVDINSLTEDTTGNLANDFFVKNNGTGVNTKIKLTRYKASDADATAGIEDTKYITAAKLPKVNFVQATRLLSAASGTQNIAHGLSRTPKYIEIHATYLDRYTSAGFSNGSTNVCVVNRMGHGTSGNDLIVAENVSNACIRASSGDTNSNYNIQSATATFDGTNIILNWTRLQETTAPDGNIFITIKAVA